MPSVPSSAAKLESNRQEMKETIEGMEGRWCFVSLTCNFMCSVHSADNGLHVAMSTLYCEPCGDIVLLRFLSCLQEFLWYCLWQCYAVPFLCGSICNPNWHIWSKDLKFPRFCQLHSWHFRHCCLRMIPVPSKFNVSPLEQVWWCCWLLQLGFMQHLSI